MIGYPFIKATFEHRMKKLLLVVYLLPINHFGLAYVGFDGGAKFQNFLIFCQPGKDMKKDIAVIHVQS